METAGLDALMLRSFPNFAWYTDGADNRVDHASPVGVADIIITRQDEYVLTSNIEARRMRDEQTPDFEIVEYPWFRGKGQTLRRLIGTDRVGGDVAGAVFRDVSDKLDRLRYVLDPGTIERYRGVGKDATSAMDEAEGSLLPGMDEDEATGILIGAARRRGLFAPVAMAAGDERISAYRHPIPRSSHQFHRRVMLVLCAERGGLYANLTRFVHFDEPDPELKRRLELCAGILTSMRTEVTVPGRTLGDAFRECCRLYAEAGFPDEWKLHHQGGLTGYASRELVATAESAQEIQVGQAFAWNPSITGAKAEETFVLLADGAEVVAGS